MIRSLTDAVTGRLRRLESLGGDLTTLAKSNQQHSNGEV
uniref:Uncharacterized protein n=1 Tax=Anguilla anguilla TaxID=7936 RepID=A0A0E9QIN5_ANGAN